MMPRNKRKHRFEQNTDTQARVDQLIIGQKYGYHANNRNDDFIDKDKPLLPGFSFSETVTCEWFNEIRSNTRRNTLNKPFQSGESGR
jgi:hypothetical protein